MFLFGNIFMRDRDTNAKARDRRLFVCQIDAEDRIIYVNRAWASFGAENGLRISVEGVIGRTLNDFLSSSEVQILYAEIHRTVRQTRKSVRFKFRCDSPDRLRFMEMKLLPLRKKGIAYHTRILRSALRIPIRWLEETSDSAAEMVRMCSWCKKVLDRAAGNWIELEEAVRLHGWLQRPRPPAITHGICPMCLVTWEAELLRVTNRA
jgi:hypothetical protein